MFERLGRIVVHNWLIVVLGWLGLALSLNWVAPAWDDITYDGDLAYLPARMTSVRGEKLLAAAFPQILTRSQLGIVIERRGAALSPQDFAVSDELLARFSPIVEANRAAAAQIDDVHANSPLTAAYSAEPRPGTQQTLPIAEAWNYRAEVVGNKLVSRRGPNGQATLVVLQLTNELMAMDNIRVLNAVQQILNETRQGPKFPPGLNFGITGSAAIGGDTLASAEESIANIELTTVVLIIAILLAVYRAPLLVVIPLAAITISVASAMDLIALATRIENHVDSFHFKVFKTTKIFIITILFGSGTDYCLFLISRYREELRRGLDKSQALIRTTAQVGHALAASAATTIFGLAMMYFADVGKFRYSGPIIAVCLTVCLLACLTLAPALLQGVGQAVFWPFSVRPDSTRRGVDGRFGWFWQRIAAAIIHRPGIILVASVALVLYPAYQGWSVPISYNLLNELEPTRTSVLGTQMFQRHFTPGETGPLTIIAYQPAGGLDTKEGEHRIATLTKMLHDTPGVASVRSLAEPLGDKPGFFNPLSKQGRLKIAAKRHPKMIATYLSNVPPYDGRVTRFDLILDYDPFSPASTEVLNRLATRLASLGQDSSSPWHDTEFSFTGTTSGKRDLQTVIEQDQSRIMKLVTVAVLGVILVLLRRPLICLYLIASVVLSYLVTVGMTEMFFAWLYAGTFEGLDWKVPIFLFVILVAIGQDYNIYLVTRVVEEQEQHTLLEGLRRAVIQTGGIITSCGIIMAGSFMSMLTGTLRGMLELGFALTLGIVLDTFVVRPVLVPAFLALLYRWQQPTDELVATPGGQWSASPGAASEEDEPREVVVG